MNVIECSCHPIEIVINIEHIDFIKYEHEHAIRKIVMNHFCFKNTISFKYDYTILLPNKK